jgi:hypothetical protein
MEPDSESNGRYGVLRQQGRVPVDADWNETQARPGHFCCLYRGTVMDNADPQSVLRLRVLVPEVLGSEQVWALPCVPVRARVVPEVGATVWIAFEGGRTDRPIWIGVVPTP